MNLLEIFSLKKVNIDVVNISSFLDSLSFVAVKSVRERETVSIIIRMKLPASLDNFLSGQLITSIDISMFA